MNVQQLINYMEQVVAVLHSEGRDGSAHVYRGALRRLRHFAVTASCTGSVVSPRFLKQFEGYLLQRQLSWNSVSTYLRMVRAAYNRAVDDGLAPYVPRLFRRVYTGVRSSVRRSLPAGVLGRFLKDGQPLPPVLERARACFALLFMLRGMPFVDLAFLRRCDLRGHWLTYRRRKTGTRITVRVEPEAMTLVRRYAATGGSSPYLFPFIGRPGHDEYGQYRRALRGLNRQLGALCRFWRLPSAVRVSTYAARHSWASIANFRHYDPELISNAMGHSSVKVTETYFKAFPDTRVARMNRSVIRYVRTVGIGASGWGKRSS